LRVLFSYLFNEACRNLGTLLQLQLSPSKPWRPQIFNERNRLQQFLL